MHSPPATVLHPPLSAAGPPRALYRRAEGAAADDVVAPVAAPVPLSPPTPTPTRPPPIRPESLHPTLWLGHQLARHAATVSATGFAELDAELPGAGWPRRALTELLLPHPGVGEIRLLAPSLAAAQRAGRLVMLFDPPATLSASGLAQLGFEVEALLVINTRARVIPGTDTLWALEQALKSGHVGALLAWLPPRLRAERLRRLQLAAHAHDGPAFVVCEMSAAQRPTAAPLRLALRPDGADALSVRVLKRRGPLLETPLRLALPPVLSEVAGQRAVAGGGQAGRETGAGAGTKAGMRGGAGVGTKAGTRGGAEDGKKVSTRGGAEDGAQAGAQAGTAAREGAGAEGEAGPGEAAAPSDRRTGLWPATFINLAAE